MATFRERVADWRRRQSTEPLRVEVDYVEGGYVECFTRDEGGSPEFFVKLPVGRFDMPAHRMTSGMWFDFQHIKRGRRLLAVRWKNGLERHQARRQAANDWAFIKANLKFEDAA